MGTDIHMIGETKNWMGDYDPFPIPKKFKERYYNFFAALADVRNGFGFAGAYRHEPVKPLTSRRGYPEDMCPISTKWANSSDWRGDIFDIFGYPGEHSFGYATLKELKEYEFTQPIIQGGVLSQSLVDKEFIEEFLFFLEQWKGYEASDNDVRIIFSFDS